jgi:hypothetical protein
LAPAFISQRTGKNREKCREGSFFVWSRRGKASTPTELNFCIPG